MAGAGDLRGGKGVDGGEEGEGSEGRFLVPIDDLKGIMRRVLPPGAVVEDGAGGALQACVSELVRSVAMQADASCREAQRGTVTGEDVLSAFAKLGFSHFGDYLERYDKFKEERGDGKILPEEEEAWAAAAAAAEHVAGGDK